MSDQYSTTIAELTVVPMQDAAVLAICNFWFPRLCQKLVVQKKKQPSTIAIESHISETAKLILEVVTAIPDSAEVLVRVMRQVCRV